MAKRWDFGKVLRNYERAKRAIPNQVAKAAVKVFQDSFKMGKFNSRGGRAWKRRKKDTKSHPLMIRSGGLRRSITAVAVRFDLIRIKAMSRYSKVHNRGLNSKAYGKHPFKMPERQFMGESTVLQHRIKSIIKKQLKRVFR